MVTIPLQPWNTLLDDAGDDGEFTVLPAADYDVKVVKSEAKMSRNGKVMFAYTAAVTSGPYKNRRLFGQLVVSPDNSTALGIFFRQMNAIGLSKEFFAKNPSDSQVAEALMDREFRVQVGIRPYQGVDKNEVKSYSRIAATAAVAPPTAAMSAPPVSRPDPLAPPANAGTQPAPAPQQAPPAAAASDPLTAPPAAPAPAPVQQAPVPPVEDAPPAGSAPAAPAAPAAPDSGDGDGGAGDAVPAAAAAQSAPAAAAPPDPF